MRKNRKLKKKAILEFQKSQVKAINKMSNKQMKAKRRCIRMKSMKYKQVAGGGKAKKTSG